VSRIAEAITDGKRVDWDREARQHGNLKEQLEWLRAIESIGPARELAETTPTQTVQPGEAPGEPLPVAQWGHLRIAEQLGLGGFGEVYRAHDPKLQRDVALKLMRPDLGEDETTRRHFLNEARRLARVRHDNVLAVHGAERHEGRVGLWTDLLEGRTLEECLRDQGPFGAGEAVSIGLDLCRALAAVHAAGLVHRDVKTSNVMREHGGRIVLLDFSSVADRARLHDPEGTARISGTPIYMAPEVVSGEEAGPRSDIYSLGVVLYRLVSGHYPVEARSFDELRRKHANGERVPLRDVRPDLPLSLVQVIEKALDVEPERRFASAGEMERALSRSEPEPPPRPPRRWIFAVAAAAAVVAALIAFWWVIQPGSLEVQASFFKTGEEGVVQRLAAGSRVGPGDQLFLEARGTRKMHVYVLNSDARGSAFVLFPLQDLEQQNPLEPDRMHRLPAPDRSWTVTSAGGTEFILMVVSAEALPEVEREIEQMAHAGSTEPIERETGGFMNRLRGIGGLSPVPEEGNGSRLSRIAGDLSIRSANRGDVWVWELQLLNPEPE
jgi:hypothetical protein